MKTMAITSLTALLVVVTSGLAAAQEIYEPTWESLAKVNPAPEWFRDAKFGIYFHWGVYSVPAFGSEWYPRNMYNRDSREYRHHVETYGEPNVFGYPNFVPMFKAEKFDADAWVDLFIKAGARFAGPVAEHHDGFAMWQSGVTPWNVANMGPRRDLTGELAQAIRKRGLRLITTFHHARNNLWEHEVRGRMRWDGHYSYVKEYFPGLLEDPERALLYGYVPRDAFLQLWLGKLLEVIHRYHPDIIWFDSWLDQIPESFQREFLAYYFNNALPGQEVVVTRKQEDLPLSVSVEDFEKGRADHLTANIWLTDDTISMGSWCYTEDLRIKPVAVVLHSLIDIISKNGVLLLNISPKADGTIPDDQRHVLLEMGKWLQVNGEAVYGTRPWKIYGEGPTQASRGQFGGVTDPSSGYQSADIRFTTHGTTLYATSLGMPEDELTIEALRTGSEHYPGEIATVQMLGSDARLDWSRGDKGLTIQVPAEKPCDYAIVFKISPR
jgi:alpha-L-fucosidase